MEHTFGDHEMAMEHDELQDVVIEADFDQREPTAKSEQNNLAWLAKKNDINLSTDSMFNLQDEEHKQVQREEIIAKHGQSNDNQQP